MKYSITLLFVLVTISKGFSQTCTYIAYDGFNYPAGVPLQGLSGGSGWQEPWNVQENIATLPGYQTPAVSGSLAYADLVTLGTKGSGGRMYLTTGRRLNTSSTGPFGNYVNSSGGGIGSSQSNTLFFSTLLNKKQNNGESVYVSLHGEGSIPWYIHNGYAKIEVGYFGTASETNGVRYWSVRIGTDVYKTSEVVQPNISTLLVLQLTFTASDTQVAYWVNPTELGTVSTPTPTFSETVAVSNFTIRSVGLYLGNVDNNGEVDEIRFATSYQCVTPVPTTPLNAPPTAVISTNVSSGIAPLSVQLDGSASSDPEGSSLTYSWNFGDGTPTVTGASVSHSYSDLGQIRTTLTVTDDLGQQHTEYKTITVLDTNGSFPCLSSFSVLNMPTCEANDGRISVHVSNANFQLLDSQNTPMAVSNTNQFQNLAHGDYTFMASGINNACRDTFKLYIRTDSTTCTNWQPSACSMDLGINIDGLADWSSLRAFKNLMKHVRGEPLAFSATHTWSADVLDEMTFDEDGYPTYLPQTTTVGTTAIRYVLSSGGGNLRMSETYVFLYDGVGTLGISGVTVLSSAPGRIVFTVNSHDNIWFDINVSQLGNHIRNIRVLQLADELADLNNDKFYQVFLDKLAPFKMLRFMDWGHTNGSTLVNWNDRKGATYFAYATYSGVPYELMIELANKTKKDVWICVPHLASDAYITQMATLFKNTLDPHLKIYLEYSNEVWNWIFSQAHYNNEHRPNNLNYGRAYAEKAKRVFRIWHEVFGSQKNRVKRVLGMQAMFNSLNEQILSQLDQDEWDMGSPSHYFGLDHSSSGNPVLGANSTAADVMLNAQNYWNVNKQALKNDFNLVKLLGKDIVTYEGGQHFVGNVFGIPYTYQQSMWDAQYSIGMYNMYNEVFNLIRSWGCKVAGNFTLSGAQESVYGSWGALSNLEMQPPYLATAPKYQAMIDFVGNCNCPNTKLVNSSPMDRGIYQAAQGLSSSGVEKSGDAVLFRAGNSILLQPGFKVETGGVFRTEISGCN